MKRDVVNENQLISRKRWLMKLSVSGLLWWRLPGSLFQLPEHNLGTERIPLHRFVSPFLFLCLTLAKTSSRMSDQVLPFVTLGKLFHGGHWGQSRCCVCLLYLDSAIFSWWMIKDSVCWHQLNIKGESQRKDSWLYRLTWRSNCISLFFCVLDCTVWGTGLMDSCFLLQSRVEGFFCLFTATLAYFFILVLHLRLDIDS